LRAGGAQLGTYTPKGGNVNRHNLRCRIPQAEANFFTASHPKKRAWIGPALVGIFLPIAGVLTALGVELGNIVSDANPTSGGRSITESSKRVALLASMAGFFVGGMLLGFLGFHRFGFLSFLFLAAALVSASSVRFLKALLY
jgi:hypothetical protein